MQLLQSNEMVFTPVELRDMVVIISGDYRFPIPFWVLKQMEYFH